MPKCLIALPFSSFSPANFLNKGSPLSFVLCFALHYQSWLPTPQDSWGFWFNASRESYLQNDWWQKLVSDCPLWTVVPSPWQYKFLHWDKLHQYCSLPLFEDCLQTCELSNKLMSHASGEWFVTNLPVHKILTLVAWLPLPFQGFKQQGVISVDC